MRARRMGWLVSIASFVLVIIAVGMSVPPSATAATGSGWSIECPFSHRLSDDPIVYPNQPGASHPHDFSGNRSTDAASTLASLRAGSTTCELAADTAGYWAPTLYQNGVPVQTDGVTVYYHNDLVPGASVKSFPPGLEIVAGDAHATKDQSTKVVYWTCDAFTPGGKYWTRPQDCGSSQIVANVRFPACWDGVHLDSGDHKSHMAYNVQAKGGTWTCPAGYPVSVPRLRIRLQYPLPNGNGVTFASGPYYTLHADFFNAWVQPELDRLVHDCINANVNCGRVHG